MDIVQGKKFGNNNVILKGLVWKLEEYRLRLGNLGFWRKERRWNLVGIFRKENTFVSKFELYRIKSMQCKVDEGIILEGVWLYMQVDFDWKWSSSIVI
jgi:hypothetical protein